MTFSTATIDRELVDALNAAFPTLSRIHLAGAVRSVANVNLKRPQLATIGTAERPGQYFVPDNVNYDVQLAHRRTGGVPITTKQQFGSRVDIQYNLNVTLLVTTRHPGVLRCVLEALAAIQEVKVLEYFEDSLPVLQREFLFVPTETTPYDPSMLAYAIRYTALHADDAPVLADGQVDTAGW